VTEEPLWLPKGSVRAIVALGLTGGAIYSLVTDINAPEWYIAAVGSVIGYYFATRRTEK
jgi:hypothetical protein